MSTRLCLTSVALIPVFLLNILYLTSELGATGRLDPLLDREYCT